MSDVWEKDGYGYDDVEIWAISAPEFNGLQEEMFLDSYMAGSDHSAFIDENDIAATTLGAAAFNLVILDRNLVVNKKIFTTFMVDLETPEGIAQVDTAVRALF